MFSLKMISFCKNAKCPSSESLLAFQQGEISPKESKEISRHICVCDFCEAEVEFYAHFPQGEENVVAVDIPKPLYELAEALLGSSKKKFSLLNRLINDRENLSLKKA